MAYLEDAQWTLPAAIKKLLTSEVYKFDAASFQEMKEPGDCDTCTDFKAVTKKNVAMGFPANFVSIVSCNMQFVKCNRKLPRGTTRVVLGWWRNEFLSTRTHLFVVHKAHG